MPFFETTFGALTSRADFSVPLDPGVLTHAAMFPTSTEVGPCDLWAIIFLMNDEPTSLMPYIPLDTGLVSTDSPLYWLGAVPIEPGMRLKVIIRGAMQYTLRLSWTRATITNIKETGIYERALVK